MTAYNTVFCHSVKSDLLLTDIFVYNAKNLKFRALEAKSEAVISA